MNNSCEKHELCRVTNCAFFPIYKDILIKEGIKKRSLINLLIASYYEKDTALLFHIATLWTLPAYLIDFIRRWF